MSTATLMVLSDLAAALGLERLEQRLDRVIRARARVRPAPAASSAPPSERAR